MITTTEVITVGTTTNYGWDGDDTPAVPIGHQWGAAQDKAIRTQNRVNDELELGVWNIAGPPTSAQEYEDRVDAMVKYSTSRGWQAVRQPIPEHQDPVTDMPVLYTEKLIINDPAGVNVNLFTGVMRYGLSVTGIMDCESWFRSQIKLSVDEKKAQALKDAKRADAARDYAEAAASRPVTRAEFDQLNSKLSKLIDAVSQVIGPVHSGQD